MAFIYIILMILSGIGAFLSLAASIDHNSVAFSFLALFLVFLGWMFYKASENEELY